MKARELALRVLKEVEQKQGYANLVLEQALKQIDGEMEQKERALATELTYGTLRRLNSLDWILEQFMSKGLAKQTFWLRNILRLALYQIYYLDKIPDFAAVNEAVQQAKKHANPGAAKFVNGVLRNIIRQKDELSFPRQNPEEFLALEYSHPLWLVRRWIGQFGWEEAETLCRANNQTARLTLRTNTLKINRAGLLKELEKEGWQVQAASYAPEGIIVQKALTPLAELSAFKQGWFQVQSESSMLAALALAPELGSRVLDLAAAPGGKTTHLAQIMQNQGEIWALDIYEHKLALLEANCRRLGISCVHSLLQDATSLPWKEEFDYILADLPCSGLGVLRHRPEARWYKSEKQIQELTGLQRKILEQAVKALKPGGVLVYSTCTISPEENQEQIAGLLRDYPFLKEEVLPLSWAAEQSQIQLLPHVQGTDGFFIARIKKGIG
ncbi:MAG: 16S rRNA (cytosine(967)-C(5))-methyltransferase RsmB [Clostridia bacterium]|nr:16S rRNA (cytosine(967)-C(5))-methyltransferase RsmB [Clostridia bacterium]